MASETILAAAQPWHLMVRPVLTWQQLADRRSLLFALLWQWLLLSLAEIVGSPVMLQVAGNPREGSAAWLVPLGVLIGFIPLTLLMNAAFAGLCWLFFRLLGIPRSYSDFLHWTAYGMLPFVLGTFLGRLCLELLHPAMIPQVLEAPLQFRGLSIGPVSWIASNWHPLEFNWVAASYLDIFGIWSLVLLALGLRHFLKAERSQGIIASVAMLLLCMLVITGIWQLFQRLGNLS
ncbi:MAG: YIP1 family protein [Planctomycetales bacterium]|nr:YIP1 family protein [bacterium]UNM07634.1 MAG: YIP1 family protein [Planctomycetales bacterium]